MQPILRSILDTIKIDGGAATAKHFAVKPVPPDQVHLVGWGSKGFPCVFFSSSDERFRAPLQLAGLEVQYSIPCDVRFPDGTTARKTLTVVSCTSADRAIQDYFLHVMETVLRIVGPQPSLTKIVDTISSLVAILHELTSAPRRSLIGLYGELTIISLSQDAIAAVKAWRADTEDRFDFSSGDVRLEVKATSNRIRKHSFSVDQCSPQSGITAVVASLFVQPTGDGESLEQIVQGILARIDRDDQARLKLQITVARSLGSNLLQSMSACFDDALAKSSLRFFDAHTLPAVRGTFPSTVSHIRFDADLSGFAPASLATLRKQSAVLRGLLPVDG